MGTTRRVEASRTGVNRSELDGREGLKRDEPTSRMSGGEATSRWDVLTRPGWGGRRGTGQSRGEWVRSVDTRRRAGGRDAVSQETGRHSPHAVPPAMSCSASSFRVVNRSVIDADDPFQVSLNNLTVQEAPHCSHRQVSKRLTNVVTVKVSHHSKPSGAKQEKGKFLHRVTPNLSVAYFSASARAKPQVRSVSWNTCAVRNTAKAADP